MNRNRKFDEYLYESLRDPDEASAYLEVALEEYEKDGDLEAFLLALKDVANARGGLLRLSKKTHLSRQSLYKALSVRGNPRLNTLSIILKGLGFRFSIHPI